MKKRFMATTLLSVMALGTLAACGGGGNKSNATGKDGKPQLKIISVKHALTKKNADMEWLTALEKKLGITIKWEEVSADWDQKKAPMLASGEIPDMIIGGANVVSDSEIGKFPGLFEDLSDDLDKLPNVEKMFKEQPTTKTLATQLDGKIYSLPRYSSISAESATRQYINKEWLKNVGMEEPTNWDELFNVLKAFKEQDANGNGDKNDEIPIDWSPVGTGGFGYFQPMQLIGSTGIVVSSGGNSGYYAENGKVGNFFTDDRYKEVVKFLNKCWEAGLVNPKAFSQDYSAYQSTGRGDGDTAKVGFTWGYDSSDRFGTKVADQYESMAPLKVSADSSVEPTWGFDSSVRVGSNTVLVSAKANNKEKALEFINELYSEPVSLEVTFGSIGPNLEKNGDEYKVLPPKDSSVDPGTWSWTSSWVEMGPQYIPDNVKIQLSTNYESVANETKVIQPYLDKIDQSKSVVPWGLMKYPQEDEVTLSNNNTTIMNEAMTKFSKWVTKGGIDKEWDTYVKTLEKGGIEKNVEIVQEGFDTFYGK